MKIATQFLFPLTLISVAAFSQVAVADVESTAEKAKDKTVEVYKDAKHESKEAWQDVKHGSKKAWANTQDAYREGIIAGKLETALVLNSQLNPFKIDFEVEGSKIILTGNVDNAVEKDLAENVALGIDGVSDVDNRLVITKTDRPYKGKMASDGKREFSQYMKDVSTTAAIKTELLANKNTDGLDVNVDTFNNRVTLNGKVKSKEEKSLVESIVKKRDDVVDVVNKLEIKS
jgi:hyperosmotically inducible periplasmic protein